MRGIICWDQIRLPCYRSCEVLVKAKADKVLQHMFSDAVPDGLRGQAFGPVLQLGPRRRTYVMTSWTMYATGTHH